MPVDLPDYYAVLGIRPDASSSEVRDAWRAAAEALRPHRDSSSEAALRYSLAEEAWTVLGNGKARAAYDRRRARRSASRVDAAGVRLRDVWRRADRLGGTLRQSRVRDVAERMTSGGLGAIKEGARRSNENLGRSGSRIVRGALKRVKSAGSSDRDKPSSTPPRSPGLDPGSDETRGNETSEPADKAAHSDDEATVPPVVDVDEEAAEATSDGPTERGSGSLWGRLGSAVKNWMEEARRQEAEKEQRRRDAARRRWERSRNRESGKKHKQGFHGSSSSSDEEDGTDPGASAGDSSEERDPNWKRYWKDLQREANVRQGRELDYEGSHAGTWAGLSVGCLGGVALGVLVGIATVFIGFVPIVAVVMLMGAWAGGSIDSDAERRRVAKATGLPLDWVTEVHKRARA